jgi:hypothetical protein
MTYITSSSPILIESPVARFTAGVNSVVFSGSKTGIAVGRGWLEKVQFFCPRASRGLFTTDDITKNLRS